jgi:hypothetical protein
MWKCYHVSLYVFTLHHHCEALGTIPALLESMTLKGTVLEWSVEVLYAVSVLDGTVDVGPEKGRNVYGKFPGAARTAIGEVRRAASW